MTNTQPEGYLAHPISGAGDPVLVLHAWWGLNDTIRALCDRLAAEGFVALAPDLYHGQLADTIPGAEALAQGLNYEQAKAQVAAAADYLIDHAGPSPRGLAVIGFSLGASYALDFVAGAPDDLRSVVLFYGTGDTDVGRSHAAFLGHFAANDPYESPEYVDGMEKYIQSVGRPVTFHTYPGTGHWFFEPDRADAYHPAAAELAWERTLAFLRRGE